jgi:integrase
MSVQAIRQLGPSNSFFANSTARSYRNWRTLGLSATQAKAAGRGRTSFGRRFADSFRKNSSFPPGSSSTALAGTSRQIGTPLDGTNVLRVFQRLLVAAELPRKRFHDLRHGLASAMLAQGVPARVVMEALGHSTIALTMSTYSHVFDAARRDAAERVDEFLGPQSPAVGS